MGASEMKSYKVGEAPWEKEEPKGFKVGEAPWEKAKDEPKTEADKTKEAILLSLQNQDPEQHGGKELLDKTMRALDYVGGAGRMAATGYADLYNLATGQPTISKTDDLSRMLVGKAPDTSELLGRSGMEDGFKRKALGFIGDIALDPTTYMTFGTSALSKIGKGGKLANLGKRAINPVSNVTETIGNKMIRSGVSQIDEALEVAGKKKLSDIMIEEGITGTNKSIKKKVNKLSKKFSKERKSMYNKVDEAGGKVQTDELLSDLANYTDNVRMKTGNQLSDDVAKKIEDQLFKAIPKDKAGNYVSQMSLQQASNIKTQLRKNLPDNFYDGLGRVKDAYKQGVDELSSVFQKNIEKTANKTIPGMGDDIAAKNKDWGVLLDVDSPLSREARKAAGKNKLTSIDAMIGGSALRTGNAENLYVLAAKKAADAAKTTSVRTMGGQFVKSLGKDFDVILRRSLINLGKKDEK